MRKMVKKDSIYFQLLKLLICSAVAAALMFQLLNHAGEYLVDQYYDASDYEDKKNRSYLEKLQKYIDRYQLNSRDAGKLDAWVRQQKVVSISVFKDGIQVFDSEYPDQEIWNEEITISEYEWEVYYTIEFSDGEALVNITGVYAYQFYNYALVMEIILCFVLFLLLVLLGIRRKMAYILKLKEEIEILEGGSLDYAITIKGQDELSALAEGLESMRRSFGRFIEREAEMIQENQRIVTEMSHDIRTPITSIMLYTEILKTGKYEGEKQLMEYLEKIDGKARRMKQLTEHLFEYSLLSGERKVIPEKAESFEVLFYDLLSEACGLLQEQGFTVVVEAEWLDRSIRVSAEYLTRIMDNIISNIMKYAEPEKPVEICTLYKEGMAGFAFKNTVRRAPHQVESSGVGLRSIKNMIDKMDGTCVVRREKEEFVVEILFPSVEGLR